jgi:hypothetical protein
VKKLKSVIIGLGLVASRGQASATNLVQNGNFEQTANGAGQIDFNTGLADWSLASPPGYAFVFNAGTADTTGSNGYYTPVFGPVALWGPNNGSNNGLPAASPEGGNFLALDGDYQDSALVQTIGGLASGHVYKVSFDYAYAQQYLHFGDTIQSLTVCLGAICQSTTPYDLPSEGFSGWSHTSFAFEANSASEVLSFLANGNVPVPPFALVDGVTMSSVPETATWVMMLSGFAGLGFLRYRRKKAAPVSD